MLTLAVAMLCLPLSAAPQSPSVKDLLDRELAVLRLSQLADGSYGSRLDTANVVVAMALSPRSYRENDGPFVRLAVQFVLAESELESDAKADAAAAFALQCVNAQRYAKRIDTLRQRAGELAWDDYSRPDGEFGAIELLLQIKPEYGIGPRAALCARAAIKWSRRTLGTNAPTAATLASSHQAGIEFLLSNRGENGLWEMFGKPEPGLSALCARALLGSEDAEQRAAALPVLDFLLGLQQKDGSIHAGHLPVYVTSVAIMALSAGQRASDTEAIARASNFLRAVQADAGEGYSEDDRFFGGIGYGGDLRPDLSNLQYALQALRASGASEDDPAIQRALIFLERSQNRSESNPGSYQRIGTDEEVRAGNDGGGTYMPGDSPAGYVKMADGSLVARSYGSMTYALLKCYIFAGLEQDDPRVTAASDWVANHWTLEVNPGFDTLRDPRAGFQGLYYYYLSLAEALSLTAMDELVGADGRKHNWRAELVDKLSSLQQDDGSWVNHRADRWWEGNPVLCTAYALCALEAARR